MEFGQLIPIGEGREAEVFLQPDGSVLKLWRSPHAGARAEREAAALLSLEDHHELAPAPRGVVEHDGRPGVVMEQIAGGGLAAVLRSRPWMMARVARALALVHAAIHEVPARQPLPSIKADLSQSIESADAIPTRLRDFALQTLASLPDGDRLCHGDFHVANVLGTLARPIVIDWPNAAAGDPLADVARTKLLHRHGQPGAGTSGWERRIVDLGRRSFGRRYLEAYAARNAFDGHVLAQWEIVQAAARVRAGIAEEHDRLLRFLSDGYAALG